MSYPRPLVADEAGRIWDLPGFRAAGAAGPLLFCLDGETLVRLPFATELMSLPGRIPVAFRADGVPVEVPAHEAVSGTLRAVAAFMPPGYTQTASTAYVEEEDGADPLPLFAYAAVAWYRGAVRVAGVRVDRERRQDLRLMDMGVVRDNASHFLEAYPSNRLLRHVRRCALEYRCPAALNFFLRRREAPLPSSPHCNSQCLGCLSHQPDGRVPVTQPRIDFVPTAAEIAEVALLHLRSARRAVVSFGQGCEGEPLMVAPVLEEAIRVIRSHTGRGTIHLNTNASIPGALERLLSAGLDSIRVSVNSLRPDYYNRYYEPRGYGFADVVESIRLAKSQGSFVSLNYLVMPGFTDSTDEVEALLRFLRDSPVDMIQWRNLNYDPHAYHTRLSDGYRGRPLGVRNTILEVRRRYPHMLHGYFNPPKERWPDRPVRSTHP
jgi:pyruvate-formate lyase-activating enzyme